MDEAKKFSVQRVEEDLLSQEREGRSKASAQYRTLSQNSRSSAGSGAGFTDKPYRPTISAKSKALSKKKRSPRGPLFSSLAKEKEEFQYKIEMKK